MNCENMKNSITDEEYPHIGSWRIVKCEALDESTETSKIEGTIVEFEPERMINIPNKKIFKKARAVNLSTTSTSDSDSDDSDMHNDVTHFYNVNPSINDVDDNDQSDDSFEDNAGASECDNNSRLSFKKGDVIWRLLENNDYISLFECKTFHFDYDYELKLYGSVTGSPIKLLVNFTNNLNTMHLTYDKVLKIECQRLFINQDFDSKFSFTNIYNDDFLADICIKSSIGRSYHAHKSILYLTFQHETDDFLHKMTHNNDSDLIELVLSFCYSNCLPSSNINENRSSVYFAFIKQFKSLSSLEVLLNNLFSNITFKKQMSCIIKEIKQSIERVVASFKCRDEQVQFGGIFAEPTRFCEILKLAVKELAFAIVKVITLFDLFAFKQDKLSKNERHEIIKEVKQSLPFFIKQIHKLLFYIYLQTKNINQTQKQELAEYLVSKVDDILAEIAELINNGRIILDKLLNEKNQNEKSKSIKSKLGKSLKNALHVKELKKLKKYNDQFVKQFNSFQNKLGTYQDMNNDAKLNIIFKELTSWIDGMKENTPSLLRKFEKCSLNELQVKSFNIKDFKYTFKCVASKTMWFLEKFRNNKDIAESTIKELCLKFDEKNFTNAVDFLRLTSTPLNSESPAGDAFDDDRVRSISSTYFMDSLCQPQSANKNPLAENALELYLSGKFTDIEIVFENKDIADSRGSIKVHGVIVASRCMWLKRALSSGMKESIDKKVVLHETNAELFKALVHYLYSGSIASLSLTIDEFIELAALADRYECDTLKCLIERKCIKIFHESTSNDETMIIDLYNAADQMNLDILKKYCINYIERHPTVRNNDEFEALPEHLKKQINVTEVKENHSYEQLNDLRNKTRSETSSDSESDDTDDEMSERDREKSNKRALLLAYAHPLIVVEYDRLEACFDQLKVFIKDNNIEFDDQVLIKSIITNEYDLDRVLLNDVFNT